MKIFLLAFVLTVLCASLAEAGPIEAACLRSGNNNASAALCGCIQRVADQTLQGADQRRAAGFFQNPDQAQDVRMSKSSDDNAFWQRYSNFGTTAAARCGG